jgi:hypothetical protein
MSKEVIISSSKLNSFKFRVLTQGIDIAQYQRNPILLWMHKRADDVLPIGRVENLRFEGDNLIGTPVFDETDEFAKKIKAKWDGGFLRMVSPGLDPVETSSDPKHLLPGQKKATVTRSKLVEISVVDAGANDDALVLYRDGQRINLSLGCEFLQTAEMALNNQLNEIEMKTIALKLGLPETATEAEILTKIGSLQTDAVSAVQLKADFDKQRDALIAAEVETAVKLKKITADKKEHLITLGKTSGIESLKTTLELIPSAAKATDYINSGSAGGGGGANSDWKKLSDVPADKLIELRNDDTDTYKILYKAEYGVNCEIA